MVEARRTFLVIEPFGIIAEDLAMSIADIEAGADIRIAKSIGHALPLVEQPDPIALAIVNADPRDFAESGVRAALAARNAAIVLIGDAAELAGVRAGFPVMHRPYAPETVIAFLTDVLARNAQARDEPSRA